MVRKVRKKRRRVSPGFKFTDATREKMRKAHKGKKLSLETRQKISAARQDRERLILMGFLPKFTHSKETRQKLSRIMKRRKHRPTKAARKKSALERGNRSKDKKIQKAIQKGKL